MTARTGRDATQRLHDILAAIARIKLAEVQLTAADEDGDDSAAQVAFDAVLYNLVVIGEAVNALPVALTDHETEVPWRDIVDMRNFLSHEYFRVQAEVVHHTIDEPLERLRVACERLLPPDAPRQRSTRQELPG